MKKQSVRKWIKGFFPKKQQIKKQKKVQAQFSEQKQQSWTEAEAQIIDHLINMNSIIKISKQINEQQYTVLNGINQVLCQQHIDIIQARKSLLGGLEVFNDRSSCKYINKQLPYQYYSVRSLLWKINMGYLALDCKRKWISYMEKNLIQYRRYIHHYIVQPIQKKLGLSNLNNPIQFKKVSHITDQKNEQKVKDHPLNFSQQSKWGSYFKDVELWKSIQKDTIRTRKNCKFFQQKNPVQLQNDQVMLKSNQITFTQNHQMSYTDSLTRIIFIYLKKNTGQFYCQGMNQLAALIYYSFTNKNSQYFRRVSQSDTYFVFQKIINLLPKKHFTKGEEYVKDFISVLKKLDLRLYQQIQKTKQTEMIKLITMKWFLSGFLTQFTIDQCLIIWDVFIAWPSENFLLTECFTYMALSLFHLNRQRIMNGENIQQIFSKIVNSPLQIAEKTQNLYKLFPKLLQK